LLELCEQSSGTTEGIGVACNALGAAVLVFCDESRTLEHGDMFLHGSKRHVVVRGKFGHRRLGVHDPRQDVATRRVGERSEQLVQGVLGCLPIYNHLVVYDTRSERPAEQQDIIQGTFGAAQLVRVRVASHRRVC
jgi:hypothetical protein